MSLPYLPSDFHQYAHPAPPGGAPAHAAGAPAAAGGALHAAGGRNGAHRPGASKAVDTV